MGLFFTLLYILVAYLTPNAIFGAAAVDLHILVILAIPTIFFSALALQDSGVSRFNQTYAIFGLAIGFALSIVVTNGLRFAISAVIDYLPGLLTFFFVALNFRKKRHLQMLAVVFFFIAVWVIVHGYLGELAGVVDKNFGYFIEMKSDTGQIFYRLRGLGVIQDPNDFAQFLLVTIPFAFLFWVKGQTVRNVFLVYLPVATLLCGIYLTHSRGGLLGLAVLCIAAGRRKLGIVRSLVVGGILVVGLMAAGFTGGREISADSGEDRMLLWDAGLQMIRSHPILGVGIGHFTDYAPLTAHNSIIVSAAETGLLGYFIWILFLVSSLRDMYVLSESGVLAKQKRDAEATTDVPASLHALTHVRAHAYTFAPTCGVAASDASTSALRRPPVPASGDNSTKRLTVSPYLTFRDARADSRTSPEEIRRMANLLLMGFAGFLTTGWFLSRAFAMLLFIIGGMAAVVFRMGQEQGMEVSRMPLGLAMKKSLLPGSILIAIVYIILRIDHLRH